MANKKRLVVRRGIRVKASYDAKSRKAKKAANIGQKDKKSNRQSPIDIMSDNVCHDPETCKVETLDLNYVAGDCESVTCGPGGFQVNVKEECTSSFTGDHLPGKYQLAQFHAHWSKDGSCGSEHLLDGKAMSAEVHFVFWNTGYGTFCNAVEKPDGLAVIGVFIKEGEENKSYAPLFGAIRSACTASDKTAPMPNDFHIESLLPPKDERDFVTYLGSLTTPPYTESVIWTVLTHPVEVSKQQLDVLRVIVGANYRECQDLCARAIKCSRRLIKV